MPHSATYDLQEEVFGSSRASDNYAVNVWEVDALSQDGYAVGLIRKSEYDSGGGFTHRSLRIQEIFHQRMRLEALSVRPPVFSQ